MRYLISVSYTHLDVYKRQVIFLFVYGFIVKAGRRDLGANAPKEGQYNAVTGITITIDVYKRQILSR